MGGRQSANAICRAGLICLTVFMAGCGDSTATDPTVAADAPFVWELVDPDPASMGGPYLIAPWQDGFVGVGVDPATAATNAWTSIDGLAWTAVDAPDVGTGWPGALAEAGRTLIAAGAFGALGSVDGATTAAIWTSSEGSDWERLTDPDLDPVAGFISTDIRSVAVGPEGLVAAGDEWGESSGRVAVWRSADGTDWVRSAVLARGETPALLAVPDGFVLAGSVAIGEEVHAGFWFSEDGLAWTAVQDQPSFREASVRALAINDGLIVAVGSRETSNGSQPMVWTSSDGRTWRPVSTDISPPVWPSPDPWPGEDANERHSAQMQSVHPWRSGFIAVGMQERLQVWPDGTKGVIGEAAVWRSADGLDWEFAASDQVHGPQVAGRARWYRIWSVNEVAGRIVIIGRTDDAGVTHWLGPDASP